MKTQKGDIIKLVLASADETMLCAVLMPHVIEHISRLEKELCRWLKENKSDSLNQIKGIISQKNCSDPNAFERAQSCALPTYKPLFLMRR